MENMKKWLHYFLYCTLLYGAKLNHNGDYNATVDQWIIKTYGRMWDSNSWPQDLESCALLTELTGLVVLQALYSLQYISSNLKHVKWEYFTFFEKYDNLAWNTRKYDCIVSNMLYNVV